MVEENGEIPSEKNSQEETVDLVNLFFQLLDVLRKKDPQCANIISLLMREYTHGEIISQLGMGKSQGYEKIKKAQTIFKSMYDESQKEIKALKSVN